MRGDLELLIPGTSEFAKRLLPLLCLARSPNCVPKGLGLPISVSSRRPKLTPTPQSLRKLLDQYQKTFRQDTARTLTTRATRALVYPQQSFSYSAPNGGPVQHQSAFDTISVHVRNIPCQIPGNQWGNRIEGNFAASPRSIFCTFLGIVQWRNILWQLLEWFYQRSLSDRWLQFFWCFLQWWTRCKTSSVCSTISTDTQMKLFDALSNLVNLSRTQMWGVSQTDLSASSGLVYLTNLYVNVWFARNSIKRSP